MSEPTTLQQKLGCMDNITFLAGNYMFKVNNRHTRTRCEVSSKLTIKTPERRK